MPRIEQLRHGVAKVLLRTRLRLAGLRAAVFGRLIPRQRSALFFPLALGLAIASIVFAARSGPGPNCAPVAPLAATGAHATGSKLCNKDQPVGMYMGH